MQLERGTHKKRFTEKGNRYVRPEMIACATAHLITH